MIEYFLILLLLINDFLLFCYSLCLEKDINKMKELFSNRRAVLTISVGNSGTSQNKQK